jgi:ATP-dependent helicase HrpA
MLRDQFRFRRDLKRLQDSQKRDSTGDSPTDAIAALSQRIVDSVERRKLRIEKRPQVAVDQTLPIYERQAEIIETIQNNQVVVISGETGSGKSTQLPLMALEAGFGIGGLIGHTQPRRIAARGVASRLAQQIGTPLGQDVGFKIRFDDKTTPDSFIKLMTDGILLAETQTDRFLEQYELIIVDEAHERSLNIDFLLGYLKRVLDKRKDFRLVITSATIDTERFAEHFSTGQQPAPIINVEGRTYPVEIRYEPPEVLADGTARDQEEHLVSVCRELADVDDGDMLIFLPTEADIRNATEKLTAARLPGRKTEVLPLYARLSTDQQNLIFQPGKARRIVLATNVAESSITVPRIRYVVDTGTARISHYAARSKVQRLPIQAISQASANQRSGRCGRIGPGICVRLYDQDDFESRPKFTTPEIRRTNLASVILQTLALRLGAIDEFPFIDPPRLEAIRDGFKTLHEIGAVDERRMLTSLGKKLSRMPVDPRIGRMVFAADRENCLAEILIIAAALEIQDPRVRPPEKRKQADAAHEKFLHETSDFMSLLKIWDFYHEQKKKLSASKLRRCCVQNFLSFPLMRQWIDIHRQLRSMARDQRLRAHDRKDDYDAIHRSLLAGLLSGVALKTEKHEYTGAGNVRFNLWPGSGIFEAKPQWIMAAEVVETSRRYGRTCAKIDVQWVERLAEHLIKHRYEDPHWSKKQQSVMASEHVTLFGIPIVSGRKVGYGKIDPEVSRNLFIEQGLVENQFDGTFDFLTHNRWLLDQVKSEADKTRDRELIVDHYTLEAFYQNHLPQGIFNSASLKNALRSDPKLDEVLRMTRSDLLPGSNLGNNEGQFPDQVKIGSMQIPVKYRFAPGANDDGATIQVPVEGVGQLDDIQTGWMIPGMMEPRVVALIRSLPKSVRRNLVPAPDTAKVVAGQIEFGKGRFIEAVAQQLTRIGGLPIDETMFKTEKLDSHLHVNLEVVDGDGETIAQGRSIGEIRQQLGAEHVSTIVEVEDETWKQDGLRDWTWGEFPREIMISRGHTQLGAFPTIVDQGDCVGLRLSDSANASDVTTRQGLVRLLQIKNKKAIRSQVNWLPDLDQSMLTLGRMASAGDIKKHLADLIARVAFVEREKVPRSVEQFEHLQKNSAERIGIASQEIARWLPKFASEVQQVELSLEDLPARFGSAKGDIRQQIDGLKTAGFLATTPWQWLQHYPRYFAAMGYRLSKLSSTPADKDQESRSMVAEFWQRYEQMRDFHKSQAIVDSELEQFRWLIEEYRVSLFAQQLGTAVKASATRLEKQWGKVRKT